MVWHRTRERLINQAPQPILPNARGQSIDRHHAPGIQAGLDGVALGLGFKYFEIRMGQLRPPAVKLHHAAGHDLLAGPKLLQQELLIKPDAEHHARIVTNGHGQKVAPTSGAPVAGGQHLTQHRHFLAGPRLADGQATGAVKIAPGIVGQQVAHGLEAQPG